ncbi:ficolin-2 [Elysia marginata]|uniref:Ficolin-2 n=1 Tax=Elysia marginata TaxID=1093978 RepID=A0AAV4FEC0_9GAST|nr:ficolin-2 [Elysia marginata]
MKAHSVWFLFSDLDFTFSRTKENPPGTSSFCGVLLCKTSSVNHVSDNKQQNITSMSLYKAISQGPSNTDNGEPRGLRRLASVSSTRPNIEQVSDGMNINGSLQNGQATLRVGISKRSDCMSEYTCEVISVDIQGKEFLTSSRLLQQPDQTNDNGLVEGLTSSLLMKLFSLVQGLEVKVAIIDKTSERLEEKLNSLDDSLGEREENAQKELAGKIHNLENSLQSKLCQLETKLASIDSGAIQQRVLNTIETQVDEHFKNILKASEKTEDTLNKTSNLLKSINSRNTIFQNDIMTSYQDLFHNVSTGMDEVFLQSGNLTEAMEKSLQYFYDDLHLSLARMESTSSNSVAKTLTSLQTMESEIDSSVADEIKSSLIEFFSPKTCKKNALVFHEVSNPYHVVYKSDIPGLKTPFLCDTLTDRGGYIVIQRRSTGDVDFYTDWAAYKNGFGTLSTDFWLGLDNIHAITNSGRCELRIDLMYRGQSKFALYESFSLAGEDKNYAVSLGSYSGTAGDSLRRHNGQQFTTRDRDNDQWGKGNRAIGYKGGWWYHSCHDSNLNGRWQAGSDRRPRWSSFTHDKPASFTEMKIRRL